MAIKESLSYFPLSPTFASVAGVAREHIAGASVALISMPAYSVAQSFYFAGCFTHQNNLVLSCHRANFKLVNYVVHCRHPV